MNPADLERRLQTMLGASDFVGAPGAEARLILFHLLRNHGQHPENTGFLEPLLLALPASAFRKLAEEALELASRRANGRLLQHLLGYQYFLNHDYLVSPSVLIPRPETEILATHAIAEARLMSSQRGVVRFAELGLGSGILSCELLAAVPGASGVASEASPEAAALARENLRTIVGPHYGERLEILMAPSPATGFEIFLPHAPLDLVLSNPPYVAPEDEIEEQVLREEPQTALFAEGAVNAFYESFAAHGRALLRPGGRAFFEIPHERVFPIRALFEGAGFRVLSVDDLSGRPRVLILE